MEISKVFNTDTLPLRITNIEYKNLTIETVKAIYYEETGEELNVEEIVIYYSEDYEDILNIGRTGFDGTIIHTIDEKKKVNEAIFIPRGSEVREGDEIKPLDWGDNVMSIFVGQK